LILYIIHCKEEELSYNALFIATRNTTSQFYERYNMSHFT